MRLNKMPQCQLNRARGGGLVFPLRLPTEFHTDRSPSSPHRGPGALFVAARRVQSWGELLLPLCVIAAIPIARERSPRDRLLTRNPSPVSLDSPATAPTLTQQIRTCAPCRLRICPRVRHCSARIRQHQATRLIPRCSAGVVGSAAPSEAGGSFGAFRPSPRSWSSPSA